MKTASYTGAPSPMKERPRCEECGEKTDPFGEFQCEKCEAPLCSRHRSPPDHICGKERSAWRTWINALGDRELRASPAPWAWGSIQWISVAYQPTRHVLTLSGWGILFAAANELVNAHGSRGAVAAPLARFLTLRGLCARGAMVIAEQDCDGFSGYYELGTAGVMSRGGGFDRALSLLMGGRG